jgi:hypothetical protein
LDGVLCSLIEGLAENLKQELGSQQPDVSLVGSDYLFSLSVHAVDVVLVSIVQLVHLPDQVISLISESTKIIFKSALLALRVKGPFPHHLQLMIEVPQSMAIALMLCFQPPELIILSQEVSIKLVGFSRDVFSGCLLVTKLEQHLLLLPLEPVQLCPEFFIELSFISQVLL